MGAACSDAGRYAQAESTLNRALSLNGEINATRINLGRVKIAARRYPEAARVLQEAIDRDPDALDARALLARCLAATGRTDDAFSQLQIVAQSSPPLASQTLEERELAPLHNDPRYRALAGR